jgi:uncharacterized protein (DUF305 family)
MQNTKTLSVLASVVALGLTLTACGGGSPDSPSTSTSTPHNEQDVSFAQDMIPHHAQAVEMADLAADRSESQEVTDLAADISAAQGPEIDTMTSWLESWGEDVPDTSDDMGGMSGMDMGDDSGGMPGMMSSEDMDALASASGAEFDRMFLTMMVAHHEGAISMAQTEQAEGEFPDAITLAETIEETQSSEITTMRELLDSMM